MGLKLSVRAAAACALALASSAGAMSEEALRSVVDQRLSGDGTGACMAVAVVESSGVARTFRCAAPKEAARIDADTAFEIASVSKTMTAALLADLIVQDKGSLDDRLVDWLPRGTKVPRYGGTPILLRHVVTHASGLPSLPSRLHVKDAADPDAGLDADALRASLWQAHRGTIVRVSAIERMQKDVFGRYGIRLRRCDEWLPVGEAFAHRFKAM